MPRHIGKCAESVAAVIVRVEYHMHAARTRGRKEALDATDFCRIKRAAQRSLHTFPHEWEANESESFALVIIEFACGRVCIVGAVCAGVGAAKFGAGEIDAHFSSVEWRGRRE